MNKRDYKKLQIAANQNIKEKEYWLEKLSGELGKSLFPYDRRPGGSVGKQAGEAVNFDFSPTLFSRIMALSKENVHTLHIILTAALVGLLNRYTGNRDILVGVPIYKKDVDRDYINTVLVLRSQIAEGMTFKELLLQLRQTVVEANENQDYPYEVLVKQLEIPESDDSCPLFDIMILLENIHDKRFVRHIDTNMTFSFSKNEERINARLDYNEILYHHESIDRIVKHLKLFLEQVIVDTDAEIAAVDIMEAEEKRALLEEINDVATPFPKEKTIDQLFEEQAAKTPDHTAVKDPGDDVSLKYSQLNEKANRLARVLRERGVTPNSIVGLLLDRSVDMMVGILGILKAGGAYLPIDTETPQKRVVAMMEDCNTPVLLTRTGELENYSFTELQQLDMVRQAPTKTCKRLQITDFDDLPLVDRSLTDYEKYARFIGQGMVNNSITLQATRGCPYKCAYCCRVWPRKYVVRSAENIFEEVRLYYEMGVRRFVFIDDIFNLDIQNSSRFFKRIIDSKMDIQMHFPSGLRGDILTGEYIDLMVEAGTSSFPLALETASPRLQKLIRKNLDIEKLRANLEYIIERHPDVILEMHTMLGFPTETEEEAMMTLDFIKSLKWIHFPYIHVLKIYSHTDMEKLALENGITQEAISRSMSLAYHELPDTLPFDKSFAKKYQADFLNNYFLSRERLMAVLPHQMKILTEQEIAQKYDSYLSVDIKSLDDLLEFLDIDPDSLGIEGCLDEKTVEIKDFNKKLRQHFPREANSGNALKVLLLDVSQEFSSEHRQLYNVVEQPLGLLYLMTYLNRRLGGEIDGKIAKARIDYDSFAELKQMAVAFKPDVIGIRALTFYKDAFHNTVARLRQWGIDAPIIAGGPYATIDHETLLQDRHVDLAVLGEGEVTFAEVIEKIMENGKKIPPPEVLNRIEGIAFLPENVGQTSGNDLPTREILMMDQLEEVLSGMSPENLPRAHPAHRLAYVIFTSGSTGIPKGVLTTHANVIRVVKDSNYVRLTARDRILQLSNYAFDGSVFDIYGALLNGAALVLIDKEDIFSIDNIFDVIEKEDISVFFVTTALFNTLVDTKPESLKRIRKVLFGGERVSVEHTQKALNDMGEDKIIHVYGPTETTVYATYYPVNRIDDNQFTIPIGKPIANTTVYILDKNLRPVPVGALAEMAVGGEGVAPGYLNRPELTAEKFIPNPLLEGDIIYLTGDLGKWLPGGDIEFIGRIDHQVKIRGLRIEPGEIENRLLQVEFIKEALVIDRQAKDGEIYLCAYIVADEKCPGDFNIEEIKKILSRELPPFMIPAAFIPLEALPLTLTGKVDKKALPSPEGSTLSTFYAPPRNRLEEQFVEIWKEILGREKIGIDDNFFELGGHSLNASRVLVRMNEECHVNLTLREIFRTPTIAGLSAAAEEASQPVLPEILPVAEREYYDLSYAQRRLWIITQFEDESAAYTIPFVTPLRGNIDRHALEKACKSLIERHESLRTIIVTVNGKPKQRILKEIDFKLKYIDFSGRADREAASREYSVKEINAPFNVESGPLLRIILMKMKKQEYRLIFLMHHIISDGWSMGIIFNELRLFYNFHRHGEPFPHPSLKIQYKDYTRWHNSLVDSRAVDKMENYWLEKFKDKPNGIELPLNHPRGARQTFRGKSIFFKISEKESRELHQLSLKEDVTLFMSLLALFDILLFNYTGQRDIIVGTPIAGRKHTALRNIVGFLVNTLVCRSRLEPAESFRELVKRVKVETLECYENQDYPFDLMVEKLDLHRDLSRSPLFNVMIAHNNTDILDDKEMPEGISILHDSHPDELDMSVFDLVLFIEDTGKELQCRFMHNRDLFEPSMIQRLILNFKTLVSSVLADPERPINRLPYINESEYHQVIGEFNETAEPFPDDLVQTLFEVQVKKSPSAPAVVFNDDSLTYGDLNRKANQLAHYLRRELSIRPNDVIGVSVDRSIEMIYVLLGIIKSGAAYLALDPGYPEQRILHILDDSDCRIVIADQMRPELFGGYKGKMINIVTDWDQISLKSAGNPAVVNQPSDILYINYTSGSTGTPNGAMLSHDVLANLIQWQVQKSSIDMSRRCLQFTSINFCVSFQEIFGTLTAGGEVYLIGELERQDINYLINFLSRHRIELLFLPFSYLDFLFNESIRWLDSFDHCLKHIITAGEQLKITSGLRKFLEQNPGVKLHNHYGSTEMHVVSSFTLDYQMVEKNPVPPVGSPISNVKIFILDKYLNPVPIGVWGELYMAGKSDFLGYIKNSALTAEKVLTHPLVKRDNKRLYRTGDMGRWGENGIIEMGGRRDSQVKVRGFRVEPGEIESKILSIPAVNQCVVVPRDDEQKKTYLVAYVVIDKSRIKVEGIKDLLEKDLPSYMIPEFMVLEKLPLMPNGKVDRDQLPESSKKQEEQVAVDLGRMNALLRSDEILEKPASTSPLSPGAPLEKVMALLTRKMQDLLASEPVRIENVDISLERRYQPLLNLISGGSPADASPDESGGIPIHQWFEKQAAESPDKIAAVSENGRLTYGDLNQRADHLAQILKARGVETNNVVTLMVKRSLETAVGILAVLKAGGTCLPVDYDLPTARIRNMMTECRSFILLTTADSVGHHSIPEFQNTGKMTYNLTAPRAAISDFDGLPIPDRSLVHYGKYGQKIGLAMARNTITLQTSRGCPYQCVYCHKIWPKKQVYRSADNVFDEVELYYDMGVRRFVFVDDIFNLNIENSVRFFKKPVENNMALHLFFPNGLRADLLTDEYIDLMVKAGTVSLGVALETASPRLQKLIKKNLDLEKVRRNLEYLCREHPGVILELFTMHGFPTETQEEAMLTLRFLKSLKWVDFPYLHLLKIYPNTDMAEVALQNGISREAIDQSVSLAYHEIPRTLPFEKEFTLRYKADFARNYFLLKERLLHVLPYQMKILTEDEIVQKYNSYLPTEINCYQDLLKYTGIKKEELAAGEFVEESAVAVPDLNEKISRQFSGSAAGADSLRVLLLDLSQFFEEKAEMLYNGVEPPLGLMYLLTYLNQQLGSAVNGRIAKSGIDFDDYGKLKVLLDEFKPDVIGLRTLSYYKNLFHQTAFMIRHWGFEGPVIAGGPYATSDYESVLRDRNIDLVVLGEGELTLCELMGKMIVNGRKLPEEDVLKEISGLVYVPRKPIEREGDVGILYRDVIMMDNLADMVSAGDSENLKNECKAADHAQILYDEDAPEGQNKITVEHRILSRFVAAPPMDVTASFVTDVSDLRFFRAWLQGGSVIILPDDMKINFIELLEFYNKNNSADPEEAGLFARLVLNSSYWRSQKRLHRPRNEIEQRLLEIWAEILGKAEENISTVDSFFELGGHSLKATQVVSRIYQEWGVEYKLITLFQEPTIKSMAQNLKKILDLEANKSEILMDKMAQALAKAEQLSDTTEMK